ncbi:MAG: aminodeoxychorismate/anthranilate synthase component II [Saprospiraceae bacterium]
MKVLVIDNYDSFVFNLVHMMYQLGVDDIEVVRNDRIDLNGLDKYDKILLSPGPGIPSEAGLMAEVIAKTYSSKSIFGVCLGHQAITENFGGSLINLAEPLHGVSSEISIQEVDYLFANTPPTFNIGHYHSWVVNPDIPECMEIIATDNAGNIMAIRHKTYDVRGIQFHPESVLTDYGKIIIENWLKH